MFDSTGISQRKGQKRGERIHCDRQFELGTNRMQILFEESNSSVNLAGLNSWNRASISSGYQCLYLLLVQMIE